MNKKVKNSRITTTSLKVGIVILSKWDDDSVHINQITHINRKLNECRFKCLKCLNYKCNENSINTYPLDNVIEVSQILTDEIKGLYL